jgi:hypothetical protein
MDGPTTAKPVCAITFVSETYAAMEFHQETKVSKQNTLSEHQTSKFHSLSDGAFQQSLVGFIN